MEEEDRKYMRIALYLARLGKGFTSPNPMVGAVIVKNGRIIGTGYHRGKGLPHAEAIAIEQAGEDAKDSTMYVTLEPHNFYGIVPPCTERIVQAGIRKVFVATIDPNPKVSGSAIRELRGAGVEVEVGLLELEARKLNEAYFTYWEKKRPFVILKLAVTIDGFIADYSGDSKWISSEESRRMVHRLRGEVDAILVGVETVNLDDPLLTPRLVFSKSSPKRFVIDPNLRIEKKRKILRQPPPTYIITQSEDVERLDELKKMGVNIWRFDKITLRRVLSEMWKEEILTLLVEGGGLTVTNFLREGAYDLLQIFLSPKIIGVGKSPFEEIGSLPIKKPLELTLSKVERVGEDVLLTYRKKGE